MDSRFGFASADEYDAAVRRIESRISQDEELRELAESIARALDYEAHHGIAAGERLAARLFGCEASQARRTAIITDIHGNLAGLEVVLADIGAASCDRIVCLGDLVEGGDADEEVVDAVRRLGVRSVRGNHDENNDLPLRPATREFLARLPESIVEADVCFTHISPRKRKRKVNHAVEAWNVFEESRFRLLFLGHSHVPLIFARSCERFGEARPVAFEYNRPLRLDGQERYIVCVGSVAYGRDNVGRLRYAIFDREADTIEMRAVDGPLLSMDHSLRAASPGPPELVPYPPA